MGAFLDCAKSRFYEAYQEEIDHGEEVSKANWVVGIIVNEERMIGLQKQAEKEDKEILTFEEFIQRQKEEGKKTKEEAVKTEKEVDNDELVDIFGHVNVVKLSDKVIIRLGV